MRFSIIAASFIAAVAAQSSAVVDETCSAISTITVTATITAYPSHTPSAPGSLTVPYLTSAVSVPLGGTAAPYPSVAVSVPAGGVASPVPSGTAAASGTGSYSAPTSEFTGAASGLKVGAAAFAGVVAMML
ncbi:hypothetical protein P153DRAFT_355622 [Dothidotthia symphoricarpi CBS 119687]|uniref:GPI anchored protein n=1 Tax=Dothidotthia symphoricarpi CBS 119687 TaxID=1392245 RepID=A0A6A6AI52_9PLEO|nr:uncharacterized protein P153DRAFT_355622 [Dothidotthia symphoricarpi CBS 119687]KAF2130785.1 hypothetical protein P153DRAFT_355622 [Dothidotthia symphoricarpi CBS 119687]